MCATMAWVWFKYVLKINIQRRNCENRIFLFVFYKSIIHKIAFIMKHIYEKHITCIF